VAQAQTFSWKAPETVPAGKSYTVSVSCINAATIVLLKNGVVIARGISTAATVTSDGTAQVVTYTVYAYGGSVATGTASDSLAVSIVDGAVLPATSSTVDSSGRGSSSSGAVRPALH